MEQQAQENQGMIGKGRHLSNSNLSLGKLLREFGISGQSWQVRTLFSSGSPDAACANQNKEKL